MAQSYQEFYLQQLKKFKCPIMNNNGKDDCSFAFNTENRIQLLSWMLNCIVPSPKKLTEKSVVETLVDLGFCQQPNDFIKNTLNFEDQIIIFDRLFHWMELRRLSNHFQSSKHDSLKLEDLYNIDFNSCLCITPTIVDKTLEINVESNLDNNGSEIADSIKSVVKFVKNNKSYNQTTEHSKVKTLSVEITEKISKNLGNVNNLLQHVEDSKVVTECVDVVKKFFIEGQVCQTEVKK